jgi:hypothetical protein
MRRNKKEMLNNSGLMWKLIQEADLDHYHKMILRAFSSTLKGESQHRSRKNIDNKLDNPS